MVVLSSWMVVAMTIDAKSGGLDGCCTGSSSPSGKVVYYIQISEGVRERAR
jgi:hypothetical protein